MPKPAVFEAKYLYDSVRATDAGINAGIDPLLIPRNQLALARNVTIRGTFPTHRPPYRKIALTFPSQAIQSAFQQGFFQGAGYYKPDFGNESVIVSIAGRLFSIAISGNNGTISEITIASDPNSATLPQSWMWQAEKWMIINDGQHLPVFFDGNTSRRSFGPATSVGSISGGPYNAPDQGGTLTGVAVTGTFSGPFNTPLKLTNSDGTTSGIVEIVGTGAAFNGYGVTLHNPNAAGIVEPANSQVLVANIVGVLQNNCFGLQGNSVVGATFTTPCTYPVGTPVIVPFTSGPLLGKIDSIGNANSIGIRFPSALTSNVSEPAGQPIYTPNGNSTLVGLLQQSYTSPVINTNSSAFLDRAYAGSLPITVIINNHLYGLIAVDSLGPTSAVTILNLTYPKGTGNITTGSTLVTIGELPAGRMGTYGLGRVWEALTDGRSFIGGDIVGGSSGSPTYEKRDAVLKVQENNLLNGGGTFIVPGQVGDIRAMIFTSVLDASLGQGPLAVLTEDILFSCQAPTDRTAWQNLTNPILTEGMKGGAGTGQDSTIIANSDVLMRSLIGLRSYIQGRRDFDVWGNVPISREVDPILATDDVSLLPFASSAEFDNRMLHTTSPVQSIFGVYWTELVALNFDPISSLRGKAPSVYDGVWDGLNVLKLVKGKFAGVERLFAVCVSSDLTQIELWEILKSTDTAFQDNDGTPIVWEYETAALNFYENDPRKRDFMRLLDGELRIDQMNETLFGLPISVPHTVKFEVFYKPDQWPNWVPWHSWTETFDPGSDPGFRPTEGVGEPSPNDFDETNNNPLREGTTFQFKVKITGHCRVVNHRFKSTTVPEKDFASPKSS